MWGTRFRFIVDTDHIEAPLALSGKMAEIVSDYSGYFPSLVLIDSGFARLHVTRGAGFDFDEAENVFVPGDEVDFAAAARRAEVARYDRVAELSQVKVCGFFAPAPGELVSGSFVAREGAGGEPVECAKRRLDERAREHAVLCSVGEYFSAASRGRLIGSDAPLPHFSKSPESAG
jgi:hypothetical protein